MDFYKNKYYYKLLLISSAICIVLASLWYTHQLASEIALEEKSKVELWANAYRQLDKADEFTDISFLFEVIKNNESVPVILTDDEMEIITWRNLDSARLKNNPDYLIQQLARMREGNEPIPIEISPGRFNYIYFSESYLLSRLRYFPYVQLGIISVILVVGYIAFSNTRKAEQNKVWVGMAKETAHQLGTPISSLIAWIEYLKEQPQQDNALLAEISKDVNRLELIAERFSKIGSKPELIEKSLQEQIEKMIQYFSKRVSASVKITSELPENEIKISIMPTLFDWVLENLIKNALDAMEGKGNIHVTAVSEGNFVVIDVKDSGKGLPKSKFKTIFEPGFSTKKRGWGLGLSLSKRIIEEYHKGKIFVKSSVINEGTVFRIKLKKQS